MTTSNADQWTAAVSRYVGQVRERTIDTVEAAAWQVRNQAIARTPVNTGVLRASWRPVEAQRAGDRATFTVSNIAPYAAAVEYGTKRHYIYPRTKSVLRFTVNGETKYAKKVDHPGTAPRPMLRPAVDAVVPALRNNLGGAFR